MQNYISYFHAHTSDHLLDSKPLSARDHKKTSNPWSQESSFFLHRSHNISTGFRRGQELLFFLASRSHFQLIRFFREASTSQIFCPRSLEAFGSPVLIFSLFGCNTGACAMSFVVYSPQIFQSHSDPFTQRPSGTLKHMGTFPSFRTILQSSMQNLCRFRVSNRKFSSFCSGNPSRFNSGSQGRAFFFFQQISLPDLTILSTPGYPSRTRAPLFAVLLPPWRFAMQAPCSVFISFTETHSATKESMLSICGFSPRL